MSNSNYNVYDSLSKFIILDLMCKFFDYKYATYSLNFIVKLNSKSILLLNYYYYLKSYQISEMYWLDNYKRIGLFDVKYAKKIKAKVNFWKINCINKSKLF